MKVKEKLELPIYSIQAIERFCLILSSYDFVQIPVRPYYNGQMLLKYTKFTEQIGIIFKITPFSKR